MFLSVSLCALSVAADQTLSDKKKQKNALPLPEGQLQMEFSSNDLRLYQHQTGIVSLEESCSQRGNITGK